MNIDFHVHSKITSSSDFNETYMSEYTEECKMVGIDTFVISEHCHAKDFEVAYNYIDSKYERSGDCYDVNGINVFTGIEVTTLEKFDILIISNIENIFKLKKKIDEIIYLKGYSFISIGDLINIIDVEHYIVILAHPYRRFDTFPPQIDMSIFNKIDAVEINATDLFKFGIDEMKDKIEKLSCKLHKNITEGSDAHHPLQIGSVSTKIPGKYRQVLDVKEQIEKGNVEFTISKEFRAKIKGARIIKKMLCGKS